MTISSRWCAVATQPTSAARVPHTTSICTGSNAWLAGACHRRAASAGLVCSHAGIVGTAVPVSARLSSTSRKEDVGLLESLLLAGVFAAIPLPVSVLLCALRPSRGGLRWRGELTDVGDQIPHVLG